jgi:hypothetical protein
LFSEGIAVSLSSHARSIAVFFVRRARPLLQRLFKKASDEKFFTHAEALDQALCYGWIDESG